MNENMYMVIMDMTCVNTWVQHDRHKSRHMSTHAKSMPGTQASRAGVSTFTVEHAMCKHLGRAWLPQESTHEHTRENRMPGTQADRVDVSTSRYVYA